jgi:rhamnogalacturonyl hydrolase YesR
MTELLDVLPENHPGRPAVLDIYRTQVRALAQLQAKDGRWHQLLDRPDSYLETSATAIYTYCIARGINRGWLNALAYGPMASLAWAAVTTQVNETGQIENVCVGTGMGFDPAFYYHRPVSNTAPHGPGPVLLAGAEMIRLAKNSQAIVNDEAVMFGHATGM